MVSRNVQRLHPNPSDVELLFVVEQIGLPRNAPLVRTVPEHLRVRKPLQHSQIAAHMIVMMMRRQIATAFSPSFCNA